MSCNDLSSTSSWGCVAWQHKQTNQIFGSGPSPTNPCGCRDQEVFRFTLYMLYLWMGGGGGGVWGRVKRVHYAEHCQSKIRVVSGDQSGWKKRFYKCRFMKSWFDWGGTLNHNPLRSFWSFEEAAQCCHEVTNKKIKAQQEWYFLPTITKSMQILI